MYIAITPTQASSKERSKAQSGNISCMYQARENLLSKKIGAAKYIA